MNITEIKKLSLYFILFAIAIIFQIYKAHIGMGIADEHFYITLGQDFASGSALFYDNWHIAQMISVFLAPLYKLYMAIFGSSDGIVLGFRYFYIFFNALISVIFYLRFRKYGIYAVIASLIYVIFVPFNIQALSYNTMSIMFLILSAISLDFAYRKSNKIVALFSGVLFACTVMNTPYLALAYFASIFLVIMALCKKKITVKSDFIKLYISFSLGILCMLVCFVYLVLSRCTIEELLKTYRYIIDPSHSSGLLKLVIKDLYYIIKRLHIFILMQLILLFLSFKYKQKAKQILNWQIICTITTFVYLLIDKTDILLGGLNIVLLPWALLGLNICMVKKSKDPLITRLMGMALINMLVLAISSNVGYRSFLNPLIIVAMCSILNCAEMIKENKMIGVALTLFIIVLIYNNTYIYGSNIFSNDINCRIDKGPLLGLFDSEDKVNLYQEKLKDIKLINDYDIDNAALITYDTWMYLALDKNWSINSSYIYFWEKEDYISCLNDYWDLHPDKLPALIYFDENAPFSLKLNELGLNNIKYIDRLNAGSTYIFKD